MTFDEAIEELRLAIPEKFYSPTMHDISVMLEAQNKVINLLREEYAPTVEMTEGQAKTILDPEQGKNITNLLTDEVPNFDYLFWEPLTDKQVVQAWLHPETIKIVDE
ncbi:hypothetical protein BMS97_06045 [Leuconostoc mesenteroides subsp. mesenteroides]|uniref:hypothetical protein n=1 Tax=Leuconostoc mesenteroides TaxID=1245 RepID=UPI0009FC86D5|nr:hypothetical protein [Leuconostoc mesenteroides]ARN63736.1 hypothetical protein A0F18_06720 [Leuconostoc mesenteroides subsp. mesenteroides]MDV8928434.1 hypothetical protein [Leuconostoc mesenteroides]ORI89585.1 hypothetical protein BMS97_06045 [Leuconostoc mesenteroides subsp. mesenteroides]ORI93088.1 hypothetical protein BMS98_01985 [Leuconostoc mesenteroides subsp. mesenteroides]